MRPIRLQGSFEEAPRAAKPKGGKVLGERSNLATSTASAKAAVAAPSVSASSKQSKTIEQIYQKKTQLEHILLRPDSYSA
jgi:DNA topoisomerase-2